MGISSRRRARQFVLQGLYERQLSGNTADAIRADLKAETGFAKADQDYFDAMWAGDRRLRSASRRARAGPRPPCGATLADRARDPRDRRVGVKHRIEIPYRVAINEAIELAKSYGGTDGHKFVNGVLDKLAPTFRAAEINAMRRGTGTD
jgi:N utilization substance protein B